MRQQLQQIKAVSTGMKWLAFVAPFAKAAASESLTAVYTRTFERAAFGFAKVGMVVAGWQCSKADGFTVLDACPRQQC